MNLKTAKDCSSIEEIRASIDVIDYEILKLFAARSEYVNEIVKFKSNEESIVAIDRQKIVLDQIEKWSNELNLDADLFKTVYQSIINKNVSHELNLLNKKRC